MKKLLFLLAFLPVAALAGTATVTPGGSGSLSVTMGGTGTVMFTPSPSAAPASGLIGLTLQTDSNTRAANEFVYSSFTTTTAGQISYCHSRMGGNTGSVTIGVYDASGNILAYWNGTAGATTGWYGGALNTPIIIEAGTSYIIGLVTNDVSWSQFKRASVSNHYRRRIAMTYADTLANQDFSTGYSSDSESNAITIQCDDDAATP